MLPVGQARGHGQRSDAQGCTGLGGSLEGRAVFWLRRARLCGDVREQPGKSGEGSFRPSSVLSPRGAEGLCPRPLPGPAAPGPPGLWVWEARRWRETRRLRFIVQGRRALGAAWEFGSRARGRRREGMVGKAASSAPSSVPLLVRPRPAAEPQQHPPFPLGPPLQGPGRPRPHSPSRPSCFSSRTPEQKAALDQPRNTRLPEGPPRFRQERGLDPTLPFLWLSVMACHASSMGSARVALL